MVAQINSTVQNIRTKVRRITGLSSSLQLSDDALDEYINTAYSQDLPADIKSDLFYEVIEVYTKPNVDRYALAGTLASNTGTNVFESVRSPVYVQGSLARFSKSREEFYAQFPLISTLNISLTGDSVTTAFSLAVGAPILQNELVVGATFGGAYSTFKDNGDPTGTGTGTVDPVGGGASIGTVVYATGAITLTFTSPPDSSEITIWYHTYQTSAPISVLWWQNELIVRPVPDRVYKIELQAYRFPTQFTQDTDKPILNQWWQYIALLAAAKIMSDKQDMEGLENIIPIVDRQESLVRNRIANEQIGQRNATIYTENNLSPYFNLGNLGSLGGF